MTEAKRLSGSYYDEKEDWITDGCLPEGPDTDAELKDLKSIVAGLKGSEKAKFIDLIAGKALLARECRGMSNEVCLRIFAVLEVEYSEDNNKRLIKLAKVS